MFPMKIQLIPLFSFIKLKYCILGEFDLRPPDLLSIHAHHVMLSRDPFRFFLWGNYLCQGIAPNIFFGCEEFRSCVREYSLT